MSATARHILVCGGAGYIGSHMCKRLRRAGMLPVTFDNLSTGHDWAVKWGPLVHGDISDSASLATVFDSYRFDAVMHFAAKSIVSESMRDPGHYFSTNVAGTLNLLEAMLGAGVRKLVFSSTAAVYGIPRYVPVDEGHPCVPVSPYGWSKLLAERLIAEFCASYGIRAVALRYFNAAGADPDGEIGEAHAPETHLIPNAIASALTASGRPLEIFGTDHPTPDGTCIRDYIHVLDLCEAHLRAMEILDDRHAFTAVNLGTGVGHSVREVIAACERGGAAPSCVDADRRPGDPPVLVASFDTAKQLLGWNPSLGLDECVRHAIGWQRSHRIPERPDGLPSRFGCGALPPF